MQPSDKSLRLHPPERPFPRYQSKGRARGHLRQLDQESVVREDNSSKDVVHDHFLAIVTTADNRDTSISSVANHEHMIGREARIMTMVSSGTPTSSRSFQHSHCSRYFHGILSTIPLLEISERVI